MLAGWRRELLLIPVEVAAVLVLLELPLQQLPQEMAARELFPLFLGLPFNTLAAAAGVFITVLALLV
jgi:hypothetical protein